MKLQTERLIIRKRKITDADDVVEGINNIKVSKWLLKAPYPYTKKDATAWLSRATKKEDYSFLIELKAEKKVIGAIGLQDVNKAQGITGIGYWLNEKYHCQGYGSEALGAMLDLAFNKLKLRRVYAEIFAGNLSSGKLLEKYGAQKEGFARKAKISKADKKIKDEILYGLLKEDYKKATRKMKKRSIN
ncbi:MAG: GNAT family N-acetyltransferase [Candidatus Woesearchaeota archaeon]|jgi:RimJ/RimL family protein N-acetyltransferase